MFFKYPNGKYSKFENREMSQLLPIDDEIIQNRMNKLYVQIIKHHPDNPKYQASALVSISKDYTILLYWYSNKDYWEGRIPKHIDR